MKLKCLNPYVTDNPLHGQDQNQPYKLGFSCGKCEVCIIRRANMWSFRLEREMEASTSGAFLTVTYNDQNLPHTPDYIPTLNIEDHQRFLKRLRKYIKSHYHAPTTVRYYMVGEYGSKYSRPHYHYLIFNLPFDLIEPTFDEKKKIFTVQALEDIWQMGHVYVGDINSSSIRYCTRYVQKSINDDQVIGDTRKKEFNAMSNGLGESFLKPDTIQYYKKNLLPYILWKDGEKIPMPRYYRDKLYTDEEKMKIALKVQQFEQEQEEFIDFKHFTELAKKLRQKRQKYNREQRQTF